MPCRSHRRTRALLWGATFLFTALAAAPALADDTGGGALFYGLGSFANLRGLKLSVEGDNALEPDPLKGKHLRLEGGGHLIGGGLQVDIFGEYVRGGFAISVFGVEGAKLRLDSLSNHFSVSASGAWGAGLDVFVGHEFAKGPVRPYLDLVGNFSAIAANVDLSHPEFGKLGRTEYQGWLFGFGPRAGLSVSLGKNAFFDVSGMYSVMGVEKFRMVGGLGFWSR